LDIQIKEFKLLTDSFERNLKDRCFDIDKKLTAFNKISEQNKVCIENFEKEFEVYKFKFAGLSESIKV